MQQQRRLARPPAVALSWRPAWQALAYATLCVGQQLRADRVFSPRDVQQFQALTGDANPLHAVPSAAQQAGAAGLIVPGMLVASLFPALFGSRYPGTLYLKQDLSFRRVCCVGEQLHVQLTVVRASGRRVAFETLCRSSDGEVVVDGRALALLPTAAQVPGAQRGAADGRG